MNKCTRNGETWCVLGEISPIFMVQIVCGLLALIIHPPHAGSFNSLNWLGGGTEWEVKGEDCQGGGGRGGNKVAIVCGSCGHLWWSGREWGKPL